jgi:hypothetical protein
VSCHERGGVAFFLRMDTSDGRILSSLNELDGISRFRFSFSWCGLTMVSWPLVLCSNNPKKRSLQIYTDSIAEWVFRVGMGE